jgi:hypothetical protein
MEILANHASFFPKPQIPLEPEKSYGFSSPPKRAMVWSSVWNCPNWLVCFTDSGGSFQKMI